MSQICPCGSGKEYENCCGYFHLGKGYPQIAEDLMRSRYSAYVLKNKDYLMQTWHKSTKPKELDLDSQKIQWLGLKVISTKDGSESHDKGQVEFIAKFKVGENCGKLHEKSDFVKEDSKWCYVAGKMIG